MKSIRHFSILIAAFAMLLVSLPAAAADVEFTLNWSAPITGGPVDEYAAFCTDASGSPVLDVVTSGTTASASATGVAEGAGSCAVTAIGPGGVSPPAVAAFSIGIIAPPGPPQDFTITLQCTVVAGTAVCEQV